MSHNIKALIDWYAISGRALPWRDTGDPYLIWVSEIILQQTRVVQGKPYYQRFIQRFPDIQSLAAASQDEVLKNWEGLGYYARARNIHKAAGIICAQYQGKFPDTLDLLQQLPGIGPYTSRAIASFAFHLPHAVLDGNVFRILSRYYGDSTCIDLPASRNYYQKLADQMMNYHPSSPFNQAMMDLGATICKPQSPACDKCPLSTSCKACLSGMQTSYPVRKQKAIRPVRGVNAMLLLHDDATFWVRQRPTNGLWGGLFEIPWVYTEDVDSEDIYVSSQAIEVGRVQHDFTHFQMDMCVLQYHVPVNFTLIAGVRIHIGEIQKYAFTKATHKIFYLLQNKNIVK
jgi:A/G-specific adenine glycosylase